MKDLGKTIKELRIKSGLTQQEFADKLNVSDKTISSYENNRTCPDINTLFKISNILDTNLYSLIDTDYFNKDNLEIEVKIKSDNTLTNRIESLLKEQAKFIETVHEQDTYFIPNTNFDNQWLRIRIENGKSILTYKKKIIDKCCEELETLFDNNGNLEKTLINLGFNKKGIIDKQRSKYLYDNKYEISLDNVKDIGLFIEIEVKRIDKDKIIEYANLLQLLRYLNIDINLIDDKRYYDYL